MTMLLGGVLYAVLTRGLLARHTEMQALAVAQSVAADPVVRAEMAHGDPTGRVQVLAEEVRTATGAAYVVVIDAHGIRHSHPNPARIGQHIEEPVVALDGGNHVGIDRGSLGDSANGKAPLRAPGGRIIGEVSVGFLETQVTSQLWSELGTLVLYTGVALLAGIATSLVLARRLKRITFGLELDEVASLLQEREATLHGVREGVVAFDKDGRLSMANDEARRLLTVGLGPVGQHLNAMLSAGRLRDVLSGSVTGPDQLVLTDDHLLVVNRMPVSVKGRSVGSVATLRDRTELESLLRELDTVHGLSDALRAQQHEFSNRLHVLSVLVGMGDHEEAMAYLSEISVTSAARAEDLRSRIVSPALAALLLAKISVANERGIALAVTDDSLLSDAGPDPRILPTIVGNLIDNAIDALADSPAPRRITVALLVADTSGQICIRVTDNGPGIDPAHTERVFADGYTSKPPRAGLQRGLGLALVHRLVHRSGGTISVTTGPGATFTVTLPGSVDTGAVGGELASAQP